MKYLVFALVACVVLLSACARDVDPRRGHCFEMRSVVPGGKLIPMAVPCDSVKPSPSPTPSPCPRPRHRH